jgi:hypothetical protein
MSLHELQGLKTDGPRTTAGPPAGSRSSRGCNNSSGSTVSSSTSLLLCTVTL